MAERTAVEDITVYRGSSEWSALYVKGKLEEAGDHYWIDEKLFQVLGLEPIFSDSFMRGGDQREDVAQTLEEIEVYEEHAQAAEDEAEELLIQAEELERRAKELREQAGR